MGRRIGAVLCILAALSWTGFLAVVILIPLVPLALLGLICGTAGLRGRMTYQYARFFWGPVVSGIVGVRYEIRGKTLLPKSGVPVFVANHASIFDFFALMKLIPYAAFVAKKEIDWLRTFLVGMVVMLANQIRIDRGNGREAVERMTRFAEAFPNCPIIIFAQGTRSADSSALSFKHGAATLAIATQRPIVPIRITGTWDIAGHGWLNMQRGHGVIVEVCDPVDSAGTQDSTCLIRRVQQIITEKGEEHKRRPYGARCISFHPYDDDCPYVRQTVPHR